MIKKKLLILGMGLQGKGALHEALLSNYFDEITVADYGEKFEALKDHYISLGVIPKSVNASDLTQLREIIQGKDIVIELLPLDFAVNVGKIAAELGVNLVNSMYYIGQSMTDPEKFAQGKKQIEDLSKLAKTNNCTLITACGMDPGLDLIMGADILRQLDEIETFYSYGAGFPKPEYADNPLKYKFTWSPKSTLLSYYRSIKRIVNGEVITIPAEKLFSKENIHIVKDEILGYDLEAYSAGNSENFAEMFNIKGKVKNMDRFSCRLPGHCEFWDKMVNCGFLKSEPIKVKDVQVSPLEFMSALLQSDSKFQFKDNEQDVAYIRVEASGKQNGKQKKICYTICDYRDLETGLTAMQRTVGYTVSIVARLLSEGKITKKGLLLPMDIPLSIVEADLAKRNIIIHKHFE